jgi:hypothetical protein
MSPDRREGQPLKEPRLIKRVPDIRLPHYSDDLNVYLQRVGEVLYRGPKLVVTDMPYKDQDEESGERYGLFIVHNTKNGLPNYAAEYTKIDNDYYIDGGHVWEYKTKKDYKGTYPVIDSTETLFFLPSDESSKGNKLSVSTVIDPYEPEQLVYGSGRVVYEKKKSDFDEGCLDDMRNIYKQINLLPIGKNIVQQRI